MAASVLYCGAFDLAAYGSVTIDWTDTSGAHSVTLSSGTYVIGSTGTTLDGSTLYPSFVAALVAAMDAATAETITGSFSESTGLVTLTCTTGLVFTVSFSGAAGTRCKNLIGFLGTYSVTAIGKTFTGNKHPIYVIKPYLPCVSGHKAIAREKGRSKTKRASDSSMYTLRPATIPRLVEWRHDFEPKGMVDRDWFDVVSSALTALNVYTWEDLWDDYGTHLHPIYAIWVYDSATNATERMAFDLMVDDFDDTTHKHMGKADDVRFSVMLVVNVRDRLIS